MALTTCPECGKEVSSQASKCPECGYPFVQKKIQSQIKTWLQVKRKMIAVLIVSIAVLTGFILFQRNYLNEYEQLSLEDCRILISMLKNPDSFVLYDDILIYPDDEDYGDIVYITYGATNSFGGTVQSMAIFKEGDQYIGEYDDDEDDFSSQREYDQFLLARLPYKYDIVIKGNYENFIRVDADKIMNKLD